MPDIKHSFFIASTPDRIFEAITEQRHVQCWWTDLCRLQPLVGSTAEFLWKDRGWKVVMRIERLEPPKIVEWRCISSSMQDTDAWTDTVLRFEIDSQSEGASRLCFEQIGYKDSPCYNECEPGWAFVLGESLKGYLETGEGRPYRNQT